MNSFRCELHKAKRRHDFLICVLVSLVAFVWEYQAAPKTAQEAAMAYTSLLFTSTLMHAVIMPVAMAMLASRLWDVEIKGNAPKLLYTLQSRRSLFAAKSLLGIAEIFLITGIEMTLFAVNGHLQQYADVLPAGQIAYYLLCTVSVNIMLFFFEFLLTILLKNPLPAVCVGIAGALVGLFSAFMPKGCSLFVPWGYYIPLSRYYIKDWSRDTHTVIYGAQGYQWPLLIWVFVLMSVLFVVTWRVIQKKEVIRCSNGVFLRKIESCMPRRSGFCFLFCR